MKDQCKTRTEAVEHSSCCPCCQPTARVRLDDEEAREQAMLFRALADPTRLQIIDLLRRQEEALCVCEITSVFLLSQPTISHHLSVLRRAGLVSSFKEGLWVYYKLNNDLLDRVAHFIS